MSEFQCTRAYKVKCFVKWAYSSVYLSKKFNENAQTANFSVLAGDVGHITYKELFAKNMEN